jgi:hypothetical protein
MLTGEPAFAADSREQMIRRRLHEPPPHVRDTLPDLPRRIDTLIVHMLARSPGDRLASAAEARDALDPALALGGWDPGTLSGKRPITAVGAPAVADPSLQPTVPMPKVRTSPKRIAIGSIVGAVVLFAALGVWRLSQTPAKVGPNRIATVLDTAHPVVPAPVSADSQKKLQALTRKDSSQAAAQTKPKASPLPDDETKAAFAPIVSAIKSRDLNGLHLVPANQLKMFQGWFSDATSISAAPHYGSMRVDEAAGTIDRDIQVSVKTTDRTGAPTLTPLSYRAHFKKVGGKWTLTGLDAK